MLQWDGLGLVSPLESFGLHYSVCMEVVQGGGAWG